MSNQWVVPVVLAACLVFAATPGATQQPRDPKAAAVDSPKAAAAVYPWRDGVRYGEGPSIGAPRSDYTGATAPARWCLEATKRASGDFGVTGQSWTEASRSWLREVLSDTTDLGAGWRKLLGGAPRLAPRDSIVQMTDERACHQIAETINHVLLGWLVSPPPVVVFQVRNYLIAYPSNARMGEFGLAVGMSLGGQVRGVATW